VCEAARFDYARRLQHYLSLGLGVGLVGLNFAASSGVERTSDGSGFIALLTSTPRT